MRTIYDPPPAAPTPGTDLSQRFPNTLSPTLMKYVQLILPLVVVLGAMALAPARSAATQSACPQDDPRARARISRLLVDADFAGVRASYGIASVDTTGLVLLNDSANYAACIHLNQLVPPTGYGRHVYYSAGSFFFVTSADQPRSGWIELQQAPVAVLDSAYSVRGVIGM